MLKKKNHRKSYTSIISKEMPTLDSLRDGVIFIVGENDWTKWAFFKCPCNCGDVLSLSLMKSIKPNWKLKMDHNTLPTFYPSVWKDDGCQSHFWIRKGKVYWVKNKFYSYVILNKFL